VSQPPLRIPFHRPVPAAREEEYVLQALRSGARQGDGPFTKRCHERLRALTGLPALLTTSCTDALELAALLLDLQPGDEVILPSYTFVSTANAFVLRGAVPVFADVCLETMNLDPVQVAQLVTPRTRAVVVVHYGGVACELEPLLALCAQHGLALVEDAAHALFGTWRGRPLGSIGDLGAFSFHDTKNLPCGEGGALVARSEALHCRAEIMREKGTNRAQFFRGEVDKYTWVERGSSYLLAEPMAAILAAQLEEADAIQARRARVWAAYRDGLADWAQATGTALPVVPPEAGSSWHLFQLVMPSLAARQGLIAHLRARGIGAVFHYVPLHSSPMGRSIGRAPLGCPVSELLGERLLRLPMWNGLSEADTADVLTAVTSFRP
jgi:dTDP-4-amino-4,6-dideoxygalactose transaminase